MMRLSLSLSLQFILLASLEDIFIAATSQPSSISASSIHRKAIIPPKIDYAAVSSHSSESLFRVAQILEDLRGGGVGDYGEESDDEELYDEYDSEDDIEEKTVTRPRSRPPYNSYVGQTRPKKRNSSSSLAGATKLATKSLSATGSLAWNALVKTPGKLAFHVIRPKHVDLVETFGLWRLDQQVIERSNRRGDDQRTIASVATIEFVRGRGPPQPLDEKRMPRRVPGRRPGPLGPPLVVVRHSRGESKDGKDGENKEVVYRAPYTFVRKNKYLKNASLSSFQTSFVAPAFLVGEKQTRLYGYKGTWQRKLADKSVIKLKGKIYQVHKQKFGKKRGEYVYGPAVGTFVMRRRISMSEEDDYDMDESDVEVSDDDESEYDIAGEYDDEMEEYSEVE